MIKVAARKYKIEPKANVSYSEAVEFLFQNHADEMSLYNPNTWRWEK